MKAALEAADDTPVVLQGTIVKRIKGDIYEFRDATGSMKVEIDDEDFPPMEINDKTRVKLTGESTATWSAARSTSSSSK